MVSSVLIREHVAADVNAYIDWQTDAKVAQFLSWLPRNHDDAEASLHDAIEQQNLVDRQRFYFAVVLKPTLEVIGDVGFTLEEPGRGNCGWFLRRKFQRQGYATQAVNLMIRHAFLSVNLEVLSASCRRENLPSARIMSKCGFEHDRESPSRIWYKQSKARWTNRLSSTTLLPEDSA
jgi:RimJ/RimL family protein N-acetyltransferase